MRRKNDRPLPRPSAAPSPIRRGGRGVRFAVLALIALVVLASAALASGSYEIPWFTVDSGGATIGAGGEFTLGGTVGQPDAGALSGGEYTLLGGFWAGSGPNSYAYLPVILRQ